MSKMLKRLNRTVRRKSDRMGNDIHVAQSDVEQGGSAAL
jgi:hypothetical protein